MKKNKWLKVLITTVVVIIGISAIGWFTWNIGQLFLDLVAKSPVEGQDQLKVTTSEILILPEFDFWTCQIGVFEHEENALKMVEITLAKGWKAEIIQAEPFVVAVGLFASKEEASFQSQSMSDKGIESWIRKENYPELHYKVNGQSVETVSNILRLSNSLLRGIPKDELKEELAGDIDFLFAGGCPKDLQALNDNLFSIMSGDYNEDTSRYNQDLLKLLLEYRSITTKFLPLNDIK